MNFVVPDFYPAAAEIFVAVMALVIMLASTFARSIARNLAYLLTQATLIVKLRQVIYGLSLLNKFPPHGLLRWYMVFALTDETYSVLTTVPANTSHKKMALVALLNQSWWVLGTLIGAVVGAQAQITLAGLDFVLASLFAVLTVEQWRTRKSPAPLWVALAAYAVAYPLAARHALVIAIALSIAAGMMWKPKSAAAGEHA